MAWIAFTACTTQWEVGFAGRSGLKYSEVKVWVEANGYALNGPLLKRVQRLEHVKLMRQAEAHDNDDNETVN